jgi:hypothetical protein
MFSSLTRLLNAVTNLADNLTALSATVAEANGHLRGRLQLDAGDPPPPLEHQPDEPTGNGRRGKRQTA